MVEIGAGARQLVRFSRSHGLDRGQRQRIQVDQRRAGRGGDPAHRAGPWRQVVLYIALPEAAARERGHQHRQRAQCARLLDVAGHIRGKLGRIVGGASGFARLVVMAELDQHIGAAVAGPLAQQAGHLVPAAFGPEAARTAPAARQVQAGRLGGEAGAQRVAIAGAAGHGRVADQDHAVVRRRRRPGGAGQQEGKQGEQTDQRHGVSSISFLIPDSSLVGPISQGGCTTRLARTGTM